MRVLLVAGALRPELDGVADYVVRLASALHDRGAAVRILHTGHGGRIPGARSMGTRWHAIALARTARAARRADVVHVQFAPSMFRFRIGVGLLPALLGGTPLVTTLHEYGWWRWEHLLPERVWRRLERARAADRESLLLVPRSGTVVTTNTGHAGVAGDRFTGGVPSATIPIGANVEVAEGIDRTAARASVREGLGLDPDVVLLAFFGFVHPVKGVRYLVDALAELLADGRSVHLLVIGGFESMALPDAEARAFEAELGEHILAAGVPDRVSITGFRSGPSVSRLLSAADAAVLPFTAGVTGKSGSLLTVLAHGLPTVITGGADPDRELVDGEQVVVVPVVRDGAALAEGLRRVLDDAALSARIAEAGARWAAERDWGRIAERHLAVYRRLLRSAR